MKVDIKIELEYEDSVFIDIESYGDMIFLRFVIGLFFYLFFLEYNGIFKWFFGKLFDDFVGIGNVIFV